MILEFGEKNYDAEYRKSIGAIIFNPEFSKVLALDWKIYTVYGIVQGGQDGNEQRFELNENFDLKWIDINEFIKKCRNHVPTKSQNFKALEEFLKRADVAVKEKFQ